VIRRNPRSQAVKNNPENLPATLGLTRNYFGNSGKTALLEAMDHAYELFDAEITLEF
jgi:hypothetical protein